ncbi:hypothetical protein QE152_g12978 [Popillia japonica]|uniref:Uncharacterized protein n=1 Tax=Popillia japonica TaxID=7064 RepID=A0AAW1LD62_POPJA
MTASGVGKLVINKYVYLDILKENLNQSAAVLNVSGHYYFQQDNASILKGSLVREWLLYNTPPELESPLWQELKLPAKKHKISNKNDLKRVLLEEWQTISPNVCCNLVEWMPKRLQVIITGDDYRTMY